MGESAPESREALLRRLRSSTFEPRLFVARNIVDVLNDGFPFVAAVWKVVVIPKRKSASHTNWSPYTTKKAFTRHCGLRQNHISLLLSAWSSRLQADRFSAFSTARAKGYSVSTRFVSFLQCLPWAPNKIINYAAFSDHGLRKRCWYLFTFSVHFT